MDTRQVAADATKEHLYDFSRYDELVEKKTGVRWQSTLKNAIVQRYIEYLAFYVVAGGSTERVVPPLVYYRQIDQYAEQLKDEQRYRQPKGLITELEAAYTAQFARAYKPMVMQVHVANPSRVQQVRYEHWPNCSKTHGIHDKIDVMFASSGAAMCENNSVARSYFDDLFQRKEPPPLHIFTLECALDGEPGTWPIAFAIFIPYTTHIEMPLVCAKRARSLRFSGYLLRKAIEYFGNGLEIHLDAITPELVRNYHTNFGFVLRGATADQTAKFAQLFQTNNLFKQIKPLTSFLYKKKNNNLKDPETHGYRMVLRYDQSRVMSDYNYSDADITDRIANLAFDVLQSDALRTCTGCERPAKMRATDPTSARILYYCSAECASSVSSSSSLGGSTF